MFTASKLAGLPRSVGGQRRSMGSRVLSDSLGFNTQERRRLWTKENCASPCGMLETSIVDKFPTYNYICICDPVHELLEYARTFWFEPILGWRRSILWEFIHFALWRPEIILQSYLLQIWTAFFETHLMSQSKYGNFDPRKVTRFLRNPFKPLLHPLRCQKITASDGSSLSHLGYLYPMTTPVVITLDYKWSCHWV